MAATKNVETPSMVDTFREFTDQKKIDRTTLVSVLEDSFRNVIAKIFGSDENFDVIVNPDKGDFEIYRNRVVVADGEVEDENKEICLSDAQKIEDDYEVGEEVSERVDFAKFGRRAILNLRQTLASKILELEHDSLYNKYKDRVGQVVSAEVYQVWKREVLLVDDENNELILPKSEQIPADQYRKGETIRAVIHQVNNENNNPVVKNLEIFNALYRQLDMLYVDTLEADKMVGAGIKAMLQRLDPYTVYYPKASELKSFLTGKYGGIGALIRYHMKSIPPIPTSRRITVCATWCAT